MGTKIKDEFNNSKICLFEIDLFTILINKSLEGILATMVTKI